MIFPEELDNKSFRLFVQRTLFLMKRNVTLSKTEKELAFLLEEHPEVGLSIAGSNLDVNRHYNEDDYNPFLYFSAIDQVYKQLKNDQPKGICQLVDNSFSEDLNDADIRSRLAIIYLDLYDQAKNENVEFSPKTYLDRVKQILEDPLYFEHIEDDGTIEIEVTKEDPGELYFSSLIDKAFTSYMHASHEEVSSKPLNINTKIHAAMNKLPAEWVDATVLFWKRPAFKLKRDRIKDICSYLTSDVAPEHIRDAINDDERAVLKILIDNDGYIQYGRISKTFGDESKDDYWWVQNPPRSVIGRLRLLGLVFVGKAPIKSRNYKVIIIPKDLIPVIKKVLEN